MIEATSNGTVPILWVYGHLICEFRHWDICLTGLVERNGERLFCDVVNEHASEVEYRLHPVSWSAECDEYLEDYRAAYAHWFYTDGARPRYDGRDLSWFREKWKGRNPIAEAVNAE